MRSLGCAVASPCKGRSEGQFKASYSPKHEVRKNKSSPESEASRRVGVGPCSADSYQRAKPSPLPETSGGTWQVSAHLKTSQERPYAPGWRACGSLVLAMERGAGPGAAWAFLEPLRLPSVCRECGDGLWLRREGHCTGSHPSLLGTLLAVRAGHAHY